MKNLLTILLLIFLSNSASAQTNKGADTTSTLAGLPVLRSYVAPDVVERAKKKFGRSLYCIEKTVATGCENSYLVGLIKNGRLNMEWMCDDPKMVQRKKTTTAIAGS